MLVGTTSIENSELLAGLLRQAKLPHEVLNAKQHAREAEIVAEAGKPGHITIATNMAGRGTDIVLGGSVDKQVDLIHANEALSEAEKEARIETLRAEWKPLNERVKQAGGLRIIGTERHESRRIDNQLRGRAGAPGRPGLVALLPVARRPADAHLRRRPRACHHGAPQAAEGEPIEAGMVTRSIETAQRKVEGRNFDIRKQLLEYDDVANDQRKGAVFAAQRGAGSRFHRRDRRGPARCRRGRNVPWLHPRGIGRGAMGRRRAGKGAGGRLAHPAAADRYAGAGAQPDRRGLLERVVAAARQIYTAKVEQVGAESWAQFERSIMLQSIDTHWREHLSALDYLRQGIHLRGYAQKNPKQEYKREAFELFSGMLDRIRDDVVRVLMTVRVQSAEQVEQAEADAAQSHVQNVQYHHSDYDEALADDGQPQGAQPVRNVLPKVGRNEPCPCGSGKKYKHCHGQLA